MVVLLERVKLSRTVSGVKVMVAIRPVLTAVAKGPAPVFVSSAASLAVAWTTPFSTTEMLGPLASTCQFWLVVQQPVATVATVVSVPLTRLISFIVPALGEDCSRQKFDRILDAEGHAEAFAGGGHGEGEGAVGRRGQFRPGSRCRWRSLGSRGCC